MSINFVKVLATKRNKLILGICISAIVICFVVLYFEYAKYQEKKAALIILNLHSVYENNGRGGVVQELTRAIELKKRWSSEAEMLSHYYALRANAHELNDDPDAALHDYRRAHELNPIKEFQRKCDELANP